MIDETHVAPAASPIAKPKRKKPGPKARAKNRAARAAAPAVSPAAASPPPALAPPAQPGPPPQTIAELGPPPDDPLAANAWAHRVTLLAMHDAAVDKDLSPRERRKEIRTLAASAAKLMPDARRWENEKLVRRHAEGLARKQAEKRGATLVKLPPRVKPDGPAH